jgi:hypothetical protein
MGTHLDTAPFRVHKGIPGKGMLYVSDTPSTSSAEVREASMGFHIGDTEAYDYPLSRESNSSVSAMTSIL